MTNHTRPDLTPEQIEALGDELDELRSRVIADLGERDADYIRSVIKAQRALEVGGRALLFAGFLPPAWLGGTAALALSKILDNMEIGHNVMHGQYDWMKDPALDSKRFEWDTACPGDQWRHSHNYMHHTHTNVLGKDRDIGYGILRMSAGAAVAAAATSATRSTRRCWRSCSSGASRLHDLEVERIEAGEITLGRQARHPARDLAQGPPPGAQGLRGLPAAGRSGRPVRAGRQPDRQPDPQPVVVHDHLLRPLPRRRGGVHRGGGRGRDPRRLVPAPDARLGQPHRRARCSTSSAATSPTRSSTTCSRTSRPTATPRSPSRCARSASATGCPTTPARCTGSSARWSRRSSGWRCRRGGSGHGRASADRERRPRAHGPPAAELGASEPRRVALAALRGVG